MAPTRASRAPVSDPSCHVSKNHFKNRQTTREGLRNRGKREETGQLLPAVVGERLLPNVIMIVFIVLDKAFSG